MKTINDKDFRHALTERFLDCDTTVEEEQMLARFYRKCKQNGSVPNGESKICEMIIATVQVAAVHQRHAKLRWLVAACIAIAVACGAVVAFHENTDKPVLAESSKAMSHQMHQAEKDTATIVAPASEAINIAQNDDMTGKYENLVKQESMSTSCKEPSPANHNAPTPSSGKPVSPSVSEIAHLYDMALDTFSDATNITIERKGDVLLLSAVNADGKTERYAVAMADGDEPMLVAL